MFKHILIPTDGSDLSRKAVLYGVQLAKFAGAKATAFAVRAPYVVSSMDVVAVVGSQLGSEAFSIVSLRPASQKERKLHDR